MRLQDATIDELRDLAPLVSWYHTVDLGNGLVTNGEFDLREMLPAYGLPVDMTGMRVLDVGSASGFFSFEFERRGAQVVAIDMASPLDKDFIGGETTRRRQAALYSGGELSEASADYGHRSDFYVAHRILNSRVRPVFCRVYDIHRVLAGEQFDLVFMGSILQHLHSPIAALESVRAVCAGQIIVASSFQPDMPQHKSVAWFGGRHAQAKTTWWLPTTKAMSEMLLAADFSDPELVTDHLDLKSRDGQTFPHFVMRAVTNHS